METLKLSGNIKTLRHVTANEYSFISNPERETLTREESNLLIIVLHAFHSGSMVDEEKIYDAMELSNSIREAWRGEA